MHCVVCTVRTTYTVIGTCKNAAIPNPVFEKKEHNGLHGPITYSVLYTVQYSIWQVRHGKSHFLEKTTAATELWSSTFNYLSMHVTQLGVSVFSMKKSSKLSFFLCQVGLETIGSGIYPIVGSHFNHSCDPNTFRPVNPCAGQYNSHTKSRVDSARVVFVSSHMARIGSSLF